jgi:hypothetical protein
MPINTKRVAKVSAKVGLFAAALAVPFGGVLWMLYGIRKMSPQPIRLAPPTSNGTPLGPVWHAERPQYAPRRPQ